MEQETIAKAGPSAETNASVVQYSIQEQLVSRTGRTGCVVRAYPHTVV